jgi:hypothetical protein
VSTFAFPLHLLYTAHLVLLPSCILFSPAVLIFLLKGYEPGLCALRIRKRISSNNTYIHYPYPCSLHSHHDTRHPPHRRQTSSSSHLTFTAPPHFTSPPLYLFDIIPYHPHTSFFLHLIVDRPHRRYNLFIDISLFDKRIIDIPSFDNHIINIPPLITHIINILNLAYNRQLLPCSPS